MNHFSDIELELHLQGHFKNRDKRTYLISLNYFIRMYPPKKRSWINDGILRYPFDDGRPSCAAAGSVVDH